MLARVQIVDSCLISDKEDMYAILNCLSNYDKQNPKDWNRGSDVEYMYEEWDVHNKIFWGIYTFGLPGAFDSKLESTRSVDIDNKENRKNGELYIWIHLQNKYY